MRRAVKTTVWTLAAVGLAIVTLCATLWVAGNSDSGRALVERLTYRFTAGHVKLSGLGGSFPAELTLARLELRDTKGVWLTADRLALRWSPLALLHRRIQVDEAQLARLHIDRSPVSDPKSGSVSIPHIEVARFAVDVVELGAPLVGTPATLSARGAVQLRSLEDANADVAARRLNGDGDYTVHLRLDSQRLEAALGVHEPAGGPLENLLSVPGLGALSATMTLQGPRNAARVKGLLAAGDLHAQIQGTVDLMHESADLEYSLAAPAMSPRPDLAWSKVDLRGNWHGPLADPTADGRLDVEGLRVGESETTKILRSSAELTGGAGRLVVHSVVSGLEIPGPQPRLLAKENLKIEASLALREPSRPLDLTATHPLFTLHAVADTVAANSGERRAAIGLRLADLAPFAAFAAQDVRGNATLTAELAQGPGSSTLALDANVGLTGGTAHWIGITGPRVAVKLSGSLADDRINIQSVRLAGNGMTLTASGSATRAPAAGAQAATDRAAALIQDLQATWRLQIANVTVLAHDVAGEMKVSGRLSGSPTALVADARLSARLSVRGSPSGVVEASVHVSGLPKAPSGTIVARGVVDGAPLNVDAAVERSRGNQFRILVRQADWKSAHIDGDLTSDATLTQSHGQLHLRIGQLTDFDRLLGMSMAGSVAGSIGIVPSQGNTQANVELDGSNLVVGQIAGDVHLRATGVADAFDLQLTARLPDLYGAPASMTAAAMLNVAAGELRIASLSVDHRAATFRLLTPARLSFANGLSVDELKIGAQDAVLTLQGRLTPVLDASASLLHVTPGLVNVFLPELLAGGTIEAQARLQGGLSSPTGTVRLDASKLRFADDAATGLPAADFHAEAQLADDTAVLKATLTAGAGSQVTASGSAPLNAGGVLDLKIDGKLDVGLANPLLEARGLHAAGRLSVQGTVTGSRAAPQVGGGLLLAQGSLRDYGRGVNLSDINAEVVGNEAGLRIKSFQATAVSGSVAMTGTLGVLQPGMPVDLRITAKNAQPVAGSIVTANLDADLQVSGKARERIDVTGTVHVNRATIDIPDSLPPEVAVLDVRRRGQRPPALGTKRLVIGIDVVIKAPREIVVQGRGLNAELGGEIRINGTSAEPLVSGGFDLQRGSFTISGNKLNFTQGRVGFDGAGLRKKIDPTLDFTAQTTLAETTATLRITGLADAPRFDFSSSPSLPQDEIMAQLLFGEKASQLSALQAAQIGYTLATLTGVGSSGSNPLLKLQKSLGLDRLSVGSNTTTTATGATESSGAAIAAGRYVSKRVYVEGKQTTAGTSQVQVDVDLTKHLKLQTRVGNSTAITQGTTPENDPGSSLGLSYQFEY